MVRPGLVEHLRSKFEQIFLPYITSWLETVSRVNLVWDTYLTDILKQFTRDRRTHSGTRQRQRMIAGTPIPAEWGAFLRSNANKDELFRYLSDCIQACETGRNVIISTKEEAIVSTHNDMSDVEYLQPCFHEEADTRILLHVVRCALGSTRTSQSDNPNRRHRCGCPCNRTFPGASA